MDTTAFEQMVAEALDAVPAPYAEHLNTVAVLVEAEPSRAQRRALGLRPRETLYGLYEGIPFGDRLAGHDAGALPSRITLFRRPLASDFPDEDTLRAQVHRTLRHELAHHFGISDDRLHELDAY